MPAPVRLVSYVLAAAVVITALVVAISSVTGSGSPSADAATATATATAAPDGKPISVAWGGDLTLGSKYGLPPDQGQSQLAAVAGTLRAVDVATVNYEGTFGTGGASKCGPHPGPNCFAFQAPPANARTLARAGIDVVNQANNHAWDFGAPGFHATRAALDAVKVRSTGAPGEVVVLRRHGVRVALVGFSTYPWSAPMSDPAEVRAQIAYAAGQSDVVIVFMHAGAEGSDKAHVPRGPETAFGEDRGDSRRFTHEAIDAGADLVLGSGPHVLRGLELYKGRLIAYSLGNLAGWHNFGVHGNSRLSALLAVRLAPDGRFLSGALRSLTLDSVGVPSVDPTRAAAKFIRGLTASDFAGGHLRITPAGYLLPRAT